jgi:hypothetical protein
MRKPKYKPRLGRVIARRVLSAAGQTNEIVISIGIPRRHPVWDWECPFLIEGLGSARVQSRGGVDALQALFSALNGVWVALEQTGQRFQWLSDEPGSGIPRQVPMGYGIRFEKRLNRFIEDEAARHWVAILKTRMADIAECVAELKHRKVAIAAWEAALERRKAMAADWEASLQKQKLERNCKRRE